MKALIIGGAGFVGAYLMRYLKEELHMEVTVTKMSQEQIEAENVKVCDLDILKKDDITGLFKAEQPDWIFHLAAQSCQCFLEKSGTDDRCKRQRRLECIRSISGIRHQSKNVTDRFR